MTRTLVPEAKSRNACVSCFRLAGMRPKRQGHRLLVPHVISYSAHLTISNNASCRSAEAVILQRAADARARIVSRVGRQIEARICDAAIRGQHQRRSDCQVPWSALAARRRLASNSSRVETHRISMREHHAASSRGVRYS